MEIIKKVSMTRNIPVATDFNQRLQFRSNSILMFMNIHGACHTILLNCPIKKPHLKNLMLLLSVCRIILMKLLLRVLYNVL